MENNNEEKTHGTNNTANVFLGILIGALAGAATMLLLAPQSGKQTRDQIYQKSIELRDQTTTGIKKAVAKVKSETKRITTGVQEKAGELKQLGQDQLVKQLDRVSAAIDAGKTAVETA